MVAPRVLFNMTFDIDFTEKGQLKLHIRKNNDSDIHANAYNVKNFDFDGLKCNGNPTLVKDKNNNIQLLDNKYIVKICNVETSSGIRGAFQLQNITNAEYKTYILNQLVILDTNVYGAYYNKSKGTVNINNNKKTFINVKFKNAVISDNKLIFEYGLNNEIREFTYKELFTISEQVNKFKISNELKFDITNISIKSYNNYNIIYGKYKYDGFNGSIIKIYNNHILKTTWLLPSLIIKDICINDNNVNIFGYIKNISEYVLKWGNINLSNKISSEPLIVNFFDEEFEIINSSFNKISFSKMIDDYAIVNGVINNKEVNYLFINNTNIIEQKINLPFKDLPVSKNGNFVSLIMDNSSEIWNHNGTFIETISGTANWV